MAIEAAKLIVAFQADGVETVTRAVDTVDRSLQSGAAAAKAGGAALAGMAGAAALGFKKAIGVTMDFDKQLSAIASVGGKDAQARLEEIRATALKLGADTAFSASEAAGGMEEMIKAGLSVQDVLGGAAQAALDLSAASGTAVEDSAIIMSSMLNVFGDAMTGFRTEGEKAVYLADLLAQAANASATDVRGLGFALQASAAIARGFGLTADDTATALAILAQNGMRSSDMGTSLKSMLLGIVRDTKPAREALGDLGLSFDDLKDSTGQFIGIEAMFELFRQGATEAGITGLELNKILNKLFGSDGGRAAQIFFRTTEEGWEGMRAGMDNAGTAQEQAAERLNNLAGDVEKLRGSLETLTLSFTTFTTGPLRRATQMATEFINVLSGLPPEVQQVIAIVGILGTALLGVVGVWGLFGEQIGLAVRGLALLSGPLLLIAGLVAVLAVAWRNNWGGIQEITQNALHGVGEALTRMTRFFQAAKERGLTPFRLAFRTLIVTLAERLGRGHPVVEFLQGILRNGERLAGWLTQDGIPTFRRFVRALTEGDFGKAGQVFGRLFADIQGGWDRTIGPWIGEQLEKVRSFAPLLLANILAGAQGVNWPLVGQTVRDRLGPFADWVGDRLGKALGFGGMLLQQLVQGFAGVNWDLVRGAVETGLISALGVLGQLGGWVQQRLAEVDWESVKASLQTAAQLAAFGIITGAQNGIAALRALGTWVLARLSEVDWTGILTTLTTKGGEIAAGFQHGIQDAWNNTLSPWLSGAFLRLAEWLTTTGLPPIVSNLITGGAEMIGGLVGALVEHWPEIENFFLNVLVPGITLAVAALPGLLVLTGIGIVRGLIDGAQQVWTNQLGPWMGERKTAIMAFFDGVGMWLQQTGQDLINGFKDAADQKWDEVTAWLGGRKDAVADSFLNAGTWINDKGDAIIDGLLSGAQEKWKEVTAWFGGMEQAFIDFFGPNPSLWLVTAGSKILDGLRHGIVDFWNNTLAPWMRGMKTTFLGFFRNAGTWLVDAGSDMIDGLWDGAKAKWKEVEDWLAGLKPEFPDFRNGLTAEESAEIAGRRNREGRAVGGPVMAGVAYWVGERGKELFVPQVSGYVVPHGASMAAVATPSAPAPLRSAGPAGGAGTVVHQTNLITVNLSELEELVEAGRFVRDIDTARTLYLGTT